MHQTKKGNQWHFGMKAHKLLHGAETDVFADAGYQGVDKREDVKALDIEANWHVAMRPGKRKALDKACPMGQVLDKLEKLKASVRAKVEIRFGWSSSSWLCQGALPRTGQERRKADDAVCFEQFVDEPPSAVAGDRGMSASGAQE